MIDTRDSSTAAPRGGWLCPTEEDRNRLIDMSPAVTRARRQLTLTLGIGVVLVGPWLGWLPALFFLIGAGPLLFIDRFLTRARRPERYAAGVQLLGFGLILAGVWCTGGAHSPLLSWLALPITAAAARFRPRVFSGAVALALVLTLGFLFLSDASALLHRPASVVSLCVLLAGLVALQHPVLDAEDRWRRDAVLDPLTGLLNRQGLSRRFAELAEQARRVGDPVSLVLFDIDRFKSVNDTHGHARGDDVLTAVAATLCGQLRSYELLYRLGGDELLLLLPGTGAEDARAVAEQGRLAVQLGRPADLDITVSIGVATAQGAGIVLAPMLADADRRMYEAKRGGRNAVCATGATAMLDSAV
ncbi:MAG TPA: GGDEF domain-containing protein [Solirubrobacteraceae bacterium]|nr:GGDEF domain-containing protein [Solirubrobacteraceae bacterium]